MDPDDIWGALLGLPNPPSAAGPDGGPGGMSFLDYVTSRPQVRDTRMPNFRRPDPVRQGRRALDAARNLRLPSGSAVRDWVHENPLDAALTAGGFLPGVDTFVDVADMALGGGKGLLGYLSGDEEMRGEGLAQASFGLLGLGLPVAGRTFLKPAGELGAELPTVPTRSNYRPEGLAQPDDVDRRVALAHNQGAPGMGGSTFDPRTGENMEGRRLFMFSPYPEAEVIQPRGLIDALDVAGYRRRQSGLLEQDHNFLGTWRPKDQPQTYFDVSQGYRTESAARRRAGAANQLAIFDLENLEELPLSARDRAMGRSWDRTRNAKNRAELEEELLSGFDDFQRQHWERMSASKRQQILENYAKAPTPREYASVAARGANNLGWYEESGRAIQETFGDDAPRFTALLAATSPNKSVRENLRYALETWENWEKAGRPTDPNIVGDLIASPLPADFQNAVSALTMADDAFGTFGEPARGIMSGPKVEPFYRALMGDLEAVVNDTHQARSYGIDQGGIGTLMRGYPTQAMVRNTSRVLGGLLEVPLQPSNVQEMAWGTTRGLTELAQQGDNPRDVMQAILEAPTERYNMEALQARMDESDAFSVLFQDEQFAPMIERIGRSTPTPRPLRGLRSVAGGNAVDDVIRTRDLLDNAERIWANQSGNPFFSIPLGMLGVGSFRAMMNGRDQQEGQPPGGY